jgi:hypothetical protein
MKVLTAIPQSFEIAQFYASYKTSPRRGTLVTLLQILVINKIAWRNNVLDKEKKEKLQTECIST